MHMQIKSVSQAQGRNALASAAYRAGEALRDEGTGRVYDHRKRQDVLHKEILLPSALEKSAAAGQWLRDRARLWNAAERAEHRRDSRVAREYMVALPPELPAGERVKLARTFAREVVERFNVAVDLAVHAPPAQGDRRNFHAHLLATTREATAEGLGPKTGLDRNGTARAELGEPTAKEQFKALRVRWAGLVNEALANAQVAARVDARSLAEQGIDREPRPSLPMAAVVALRRGERSVVAERIFERYRQRVADRQTAAERGAVPQARPLGETAVTQAHRAMPAVAPAPSPAAAPVQDSEVRRRQAVQEWLTLRAAEGRAVGPQAEPRTDTEDLRRQAVESWRRMRSKEGERLSGEPVATTDRAAEQDNATPAQSPGRDPDFSL